MKELRLQFKYTQSEYVKAERQYLIASKTVRRYDPILAAVFLLFSMRYLFLSSFSGFSVMILGVLIIVTALGSFLYILAPVLKFKRTAKYHEEYTLTFSKDAIEFKTPSIESRLAWDVYSELWESDDFYFLIQAPRMYTLIPKRVLKDENEEQAFQELAQLNSIRRISKMRREKTEKKKTI